MSDAVTIPEHGGEPVKNPRAEPVVPAAPGKHGHAPESEQQGLDSGGETPSLVSRYFSDAARFPLLSQEQERKLCARLTRALTAIASARDLPADTPMTLREVTGALEPENLPTRRLRRFLRIANACRDTLIRSNLRLATHIARRYGTYGPLLTDLIQDGNVGLIKAVERFDPKRGFRFSTYAYWWITEEVKRCVKRGRGVVKTPDHVVDEIYALQSSRARLFSHLGRDASATELSRTLGISVERVNALTRYASPEVSTDTPINADGDIALGDILTCETDNNPEVGLVSRDRRRMLDDILSRLNERERDILLRRFGLGRSQPETLQVISDKLAISRERVRQIEKGALAKLRNQYASMAGLGGM